MVLGNGCVGDAERDGDGGERRPEREGRNGDYRALFEAQVGSA